PASGVAISSEAYLDCESNEVDGGAHAELLAHDLRRVGDRLVGGVNEPRDLGETFAGAEQPQYLHFARGQFGKRAPGERGSGECDASCHCGRQVSPALSDFTDGFDEVMGVAGFGDITPGTDFTG